MKFERAPVNLVRAWASAADRDEDKAVSGATERISDKCAETVWYSRSNSSASDPVSRRLCARKVSRDHLSPCTAEKASMSTAPPYPCLPYPCLPYLCPIPVCPDGRG